MSKEQSFFNAIIVEGGAMRGVFTTGVLDGFLAAGFNPFDLFIGVSSGAGNLAAYLAEMPKRNYKIYTDYSLRPEFMSLRRFVFGGHLMDLDWLWEKTIYAKQKLFLVCMTDVETGKPVYKNTSAENLEAVLKASRALPVFYRNFPVIDGNMSADGGLADPLPVQEAISQGARKIMVVRSRLKNYVKKENLSQGLLLWMLRKYPSLKTTISARVDGFVKSPNSLLRFILRFFMVR